MTLLRVDHSLKWEMNLCESGYTSHSLVDKDGVRWGWIVNAEETMWSSHVGDWGQAETRGVKSPLGRKEELYASFLTISEAKGWVEEGVADAWKRKAGRDGE